jgi:RHS repeat-associated protein
MALGSVRFASIIGNRASYFDRAYAPFRETYDNFGNTSGNNFTGDTQDTVSGTYDTPNRELNPNQGRWLSPDPAGLGAVDSKHSPDLEQVCVCWKYAAELY